MSLAEIDDTHDPARTSWVPGADGHAAFPVQNLPFGVFAPGDADPRIGVAIGDHILDLRACVDAGVLDDVDGALLRPILNELLARMPADRRALRRRLSLLLCDPAHRPAIAHCLHAAGDCALHLPARIGDYTDFYVGIHHATNIGRLFRPDNPLLPNYKHVPIGYHGRASSVIVSGRRVVRPNGQRKALGEDAPSFGASRRLDYELELGVWIGGPENALGAPVPLSEAAGRVAGLCLLNDWSARDLQAWEYQPLGPFLAKSFATTISPWVVTAEALAPFRIAQQARPEGDPRPLPYLWDEGDQQGGAFAIALEVHITTSCMRAGGLPPHRLSESAARHMYWTVGQIVTHHASNGCNLAAGDLLGTGTLSAPDPGGLGSLMEMALGGAQPVVLPGGEQRVALEDGDEITLSATARAQGFVSIGFGPCTGTILAAPPV